MTDRRVNPDAGRNESLPLNLKNMTFPCEIAREDRGKPSTWMVRLLILGATMLLIVNLAGTKAAGQTPAPVQRVLVLYSDERLLPANIIVDEAIRATFAVGTNNRIEFYSEFLDVARFPGEEQQQRQRDFFRDKYRERPPDLVIAVSGGALVFLAKHRTELVRGSTDRLLSRRR